MQSKSLNYYPKCKSLKRDPHNSNLIAFSYGKSFQIVDTRELGKNKSLIEYNNMELKDCFHQILDIDYNPIKLNVLVSANDDSTIRFWD